MNFDYLFLAVGDSDFLTELQTQITQDFPRAQLQTTTDQNDGRDFCQANVYDLIFSQTEVQGESVGPMLDGIREMDNDNRDTGALLFGEVKRPLKSLDFVMVAPNMQEYLAPARTLLSLKR